jgi:hypothetical protein
MMGEGEKRELAGEIRKRKQGIGGEKGNYSNSP